MGSPLAGVLPSALPGLHGADIYLLIFGLNLATAVGTPVQIGRLKETIPSRST